MAKTAAKLSVALWSCAMIFGSAAATLTGRFTSGWAIPEMLLWLTSALSFSALLYQCFRGAIRKGFPVALALMFPTVLVLAFAQAGAGFIISSSLQEVVPKEQAPAPTLARVLMAAFVCAGLYACNAALFWILHGNQVATAAEMRADRTELARLRLQLNPHFLCNSLNALSCLIIEGRDVEANEMAERMAEFLRMVAEDNSADVQLVDELAVVAAYLHVERVRFRDRLLVEISCEPEVERALVPSFILQPLVENSLHHAVSVSRCPVTVSITGRAESEQLVLTVKDNGPGVKAPTRRSGRIGLRNTRERLHMQYGGDGHVEARPSTSGYQTIIRIPLRLEEPAERARRD